MSTPSPEFHLPVAEIVKHVPMLLRGEATKFVSEIDNMDLNHDGKRDVAQIAKFVLAVLPLVAKLEKAIDFPALETYVLAQPWCKDPAVAKEILDVIAEASKAA